MSDIWLVSIATAIVFFFIGHAVGSHETMNMFRRAFRSMWLLKKLGNDDKANEIRIMLEDLLNYD